MKKISSGVQFVVYDIGNGRVAKKQTSFIQKLITLHRIAPKYHLYSHPIHNIVTAIGAKKTTDLSIKKLQECIEDIDPTLIGNPSFTHDGGYEQDKVFLFGDQIRLANQADQRGLVDRYIENILSCWDYGFSDTVFNFMLNSGVTANGEVMLIDLGELTWSKEEIAELVRTKHWEKRSSYNKLWDTDLKKYMQDKFSEQITLENLELRWNGKYKLNKF